MSHSKISDTTKRNKAIRRLIEAGENLTRHLDWDWSATDEPYNKWKDAKKAAELVLGITDTAARPRESKTQP